MGSRTSLPTTERYLRIDVSTLPVQPPADNPLVSLNTVPDDDFVVAMGLRNPFRITARPGTNEIWIADVGWGTWEEINRITDPTGDVENFGWPCYEGNNSGSSVQGNYQNRDLCQDLYNDQYPTRYRHNPRTLRLSAQRTSRSRGAVWHW